MTRLLHRYTVPFCLLITFWTAIVPVARSFFRAEVSYNEGWNIYAAAALAQQQPLYPTPINGRR